MPASIHGAPTAPYHADDPDPCSDPSSVGTSDETQWPDGGSCPAAIRIATIAASTRERSAESAMDDIAAEVGKYFWFHSIDLGGGIVTPGTKTPDIHRLESAAFFDSVELSGQAVLDIGAWNGFYSFEAKRRGAARVLATDSFCWTHAGFQGRKTFDLAHRSLGLDIETKEIDAADIAVETVGEFDVVLFLGVFYHRYDPIEPLARAARVARKLLIVESHLDLQDIDRPAMAFYPPGRKPLDDETNWWGPNIPCLNELLRTHGFAEIDIAIHPTQPNRAIFHAWRATGLRRDAGR
jgi:tRNA (mo5U34)-methyltransferase